ncbi:acrosomal protein KIAA1210 homolog isoform X2 [Erythrolamprus reginae]
MTTSEEQTEALEGEEAADDASSGKKKSKFQTFKNFFAKKKKSKDLLSCPEETKRKPSHENSDGGSPPPDSILLHSPGETEFNGSMGNQALLQDDEFPSEALWDVIGDAPLQENLPGKGKNFEQNFCCESALVISSSDRMDDLNAVSEDDGLPSILLDISTIHDVLASSIAQPSSPLQRCVSLSSDETDDEDNPVNISQVTSGSPSKHRGSFPPGSPISPLNHGILVDFNTPASPMTCLDTSAARHRIAMNPRKQKGFVKKTHQSLVEQMLEKQRSLESDEDKRSPPKILEEAAGQRKVWEGLPSHGVVNTNEDGTDHTSPGTKTSEVLSSSVLWGDGPSALLPDAKNLLEAQPQLSSTKPAPNVPSPPLKDSNGENIDNETEKKGTSDQKAQSGPGATENSESFHLKTKAVGLHRDLPKSKLGKELGAEDNQIAHSQRTDARANVSKPARKRHRTGDRADGETSPALEIDAVLGVPQLSALKGSSDASRNLTCKSMPSVNEDGRRPSDMELQPSPGPGKPTDSLQGTLSTSEVDLGRPVLLNAAGKKTCLVPTDSTIQEMGSPPTVGSTEVASKTRLPINTPGVQLGNVTTEEESKATEKMKTQAKAPSVKPVRFTIAPAWQRSLSGGSSSVDYSCPRNSPTSPVKPELFEGTSPPMASSQILSTPERSDGANKNTGVPLNSSSEEVQNCESPFGVKLRRTSSLLKYQTEHHWDLPKLKVPLAVSPPSSAKTETKAANSGTNLQNLTTGVKGLVANSGTQEKNLQKTKAGEEGAKVQKTKAGEEGAKVQKTKAGEEGAKLQKTKAGEEGAKLQKTKAGEEGIKLQKIKAVEEGAKLQKTKAVEEGAKLQKTKAVEEGAKLQKTKAVEEGAKLQKTKAVEEGAKLQKTKAGEEGIKLQKAKGGEESIKLQKTKAGEEGIKLQKTKAGEEGTKLQKTKPGEEGTKLQKTKAAEEGIKLQKTKPGEEGTKPQASKSSEGRARILPQESPRGLEKDPRLLPILTVASCSSTEPPWLSLAKKKAKAWSEMPQAVQ